MMKRNYKSITKGISVFSTEGKELLIEATDAGYAQWPRLQKFYRKQIGETYCGIASLGITLECLLYSKTQEIDLSEDTIFQYLTVETLSKVPRSKIDTSGLSLEDLHLLSSGFNIPNFKITPEHYPADKHSIDSFREHLQSALQSKTSFILINFLVDALPGYEFTGGHWSPIAGYNPAHDLVLLCDVTNVVAWYPMQKIWNAINTKPCKCHSRGYIRIDALTLKPQK